ncbi:Ribosome biogenesis protein Erb1 [Malassezia pachydermatis]|uniref:Ribosome biogenesis protein ERB1 n=1 Tax=Malassezia pachydermatis TaxID=77020 RepID=A0A0M8MN18_9BASI|nr:rrna processing-related protein [Malassezia pachydermatis]KOS13397.1 rrna processing-related protein [Malassezia pachydermatis]
MSETRRGRDRATAPASSVATAGGRKRAQPGAVPTKAATAPAKSKAEPALLANDAALAWDDDEDDDDAASAADEDSEEEPFPELHGDGDEDEEEDDDSGFASDEIDQWDDKELEAHADADADEDDLREGDEALARMIARARVKPDESERRTNRLGIDVNIAAKLYGEDRHEDGSSRGRLVRSKITGEEKMEYPAIEPEYDSDSSTEDVENRVGNVPMEWYDDLPHIGYDINGRRVLRPAKGDELDKFLASVEGDGDAWFSAHDQTSGRDVKLTDEELDIIQRLQRAEVPVDDYDPYEPATDWFTQHQHTMPLSARPEPKRRFVPSKWEHKKVMKIVRAIRQGRIVAHAPGKERPAFYSIWTDADEARADHPMHMPAPKLPLPTHIESYNPPAEYLFNDEERAEWEAAEPEDRKIPFLPAKYASLRLVPGYDGALQERFQRCLDLYLAPRMRRQRLDIDDPESLLPKLPTPRELRPFPTHTDVMYTHTSRVRAASVDPTGAWLLTGADDGHVRLWDMALGRCVATWDANAGVAQGDRSPVYSVQWSPNKQHAIAAVASVGRVTLLAPPQCGAVHTPSQAFLTPPAAAEDAQVARWTRASEADRARGVCVRIHLHSAKGSELVPKQVRWHTRGDYFATVCPDAGGGAVLIHQVSKHRSQAPFKKARRSGSSSFAVQCVAFHPSRPVLFVATQRYVRMYDLAQQTLVKTLQPGVRWISSLDVHPSGDHLLVGSYDRRVLWFDLDLSERPYKTLRYHTRAVRAVAFHPRYPLFASASDDGTVHVYHGTVYSDLLQNALLVPLKILRGHTVQEALGVLGLQWHPTLPWLLSAGADGDARLWTP